MLKLQRVLSVAIFPTYSTENAACFDLSACLEAWRNIKVYRSSNEFQYVECELIPNTEGHGAFILQPGERALIPTGFIFHMDKGASVRLYSRSGLSTKNGIVLANQVGIIDSDYTQQVYIPIVNNSVIDQYVTHGERLCQAELVYSSFPRPQLVEVTEDEVVPNKTDRVGGFGSTGV